jgi:DNA-binding transcriptional regulator YiaG
VLLETTPNLLYIHFRSSSRRIFTPSPSYLFSKPLNSLDLDPTYPKNPKTVGDYIRKWKMDKGLLMRELAEHLGVTEDTVINWEVRGTAPTKESLHKVVDLIANVSRLFQDP